MLLPAIPEYDQAVLNLQKTVKSSHFSGGRPQADKGALLVKGYTGAVSRVYPIDVNGRRKALRCWFVEVQDVESRYTVMRRYLSQHPAKCLANFEYIKNGIDVKGHTWPILYMEWVDGIRLNRFLDQNIRSPNLIKSLAEGFVDMVAELHKKKISHGDLQDGNILITGTSGSHILTLIDYDTIHAPPLNGVPRKLMGLPSYQSPYPREESLDPLKADHFSELVIYLSLRAFSEVPELWHINTEKKLLFDESDYKNPRTSNAFSRLSSLSSEIRFLNKKLAEYCAQRDLNRLQPLEVVLRENRRNFGTGDLLVEAYFVPKEPPEFFSPTGLDPWNKTHLAATAKETEQSEIEAFFRQDSQPPKEPVKRLSTPGATPPTIPKKQSNEGVFWIVLVVAISLVALCMLVNILTL